LIKDKNRTITCKRSFELKSFIIKFTTIYAHKQNRAVERSIRGKGNGIIVSLSATLVISHSFLLSRL